MQLLRTDWGFRRSSNSATQPKPDPPPPTMTNHLNMLSSLVAHAAPWLSACMVDNVSLVLAMVAGSVAAHGLRTLSQHWRQVRLSTGVFWRQVSAVRLLLDDLMSGWHHLLPACLPLMA